MRKLILIFTLSFLIIGNANSEKTTEQKCIEKYLYKYEDVKYINYCKNIETFISKTKFGKFKLMFESSSGLYLKE